MEPMSVNDLVADARTRIRGLSMEEAQREFESGEAVIVDIRDVRERWREGAIPGSKHVPRGMLEFWVDPESKYHKPVFAADKQFVFFCAAGQRSALATQCAQRMGLNPVAHIAGGFTAWKAAGGPVEMPESRSKA